MSYSSDLQDDLAFAAGEVGYATILDFCTAIRTAHEGFLFGYGVRTVANFDQDGTVYVADVNSGNWNVAITNELAGDLSVAAAGMSAQNVEDAFWALIPNRNEMDDETVTMLFAVDDTIGEANAVKQVGKLVNSWFENLRIDDDNSPEVTNVDSHDMGVNLIAVEITRVATLPHV